MEETMEVAKLLRDLVKDNQNLLVNYETLLPKLQEAGVKGGDYRAIHNALQYKIGEVMTLVDTSSLDSIKQGRKDLQRTLQANNMLPARIDFIVDVFTYALGWQEAEERLEYAQDSAAGESNPDRVDAVFLLTITGFPAASRRSLGRVSVPMWPFILSDRLLIVALVGR